MGWLVGWLVGCFVVVVSGAHRIHHRATEEKPPTDRQHRAAGPLRCAPPRDFNHRTRPEPPQHWPPLFPDTLKNRRVDFVTFNVWGCSAVVGRDPSGRNRIDRVHLVRRRRRSLEVGTWKVGLDWSPVPLVVIGWLGGTQGERWLVAFTSVRRSLTTLFGYSVTNWLWS